MKQLLAGCLVMLSLASCSGLIAKPDTARQIGDDVYLMTARVGTTQPAPAIAENAVRFEFYHDTATVNLWAYLFGPKSLYVTAVIYGDLEKKAALSAEYDRRMKASTQPSTQPVATNPTYWLNAEAVWMTNILRELKGV